MPDRSLFLCACSCCGRGPCVVNPFLFLPLLSNLPLVFALSLFVLLVVSCRVVSCLVVLACLLLVHLQSSSIPPSFAPIFSSSSFCLLISLFSLLISACVSMHVFFTHTHTHTGPCSGRCPCVFHHLSSPLSLFSACLVFVLLCFWSLPCHCLSLCDALVLPRY
jgi:hypothetical protein